MIAWIFRSVLVWLGMRFLRSLFKDNRRRRPSRAF
jgi:hypothetical protein